MLLRDVPGFQLCLCVSLDEKSPGQGASDGWQQLRSLLCTPLLASPGRWGEMGPLPTWGVGKVALGHSLVPGMALWRWRTG